MGKVSEDKVDFCLHRQFWMSRLQKSSFTSAFKAQLAQTDYNKMSSKDEKAKKGTKRKSMAPEPIREDINVVVAQSSSSTAGPVLGMSCAC